MTLQDLSTIGQTQLVGWIEGELATHPEKPLQEVVAAFLAYVESLASAESQRPDSVANQHRPWTQQPFFA